MRWFSSRYRRIPRYPSTATESARSEHVAIGRQVIEVFASIRRVLGVPLALAEHRPPAGRIEALNNNWETLVRRARGCRDHHYLLLKLRFMIVNPIRNDRGVERFLALGLTPPRTLPEAA